MRFHSLLRSRRLQLFFAFSILLPAALPSVAQQTQSSPAQSSSSQSSSPYLRPDPPQSKFRFDIAGSAFAQITAASNGNLIREDTNRSYGGLVSLRQPYRPWLGWEVNYGLTSFPEFYRKGVVTVHDMVHEITAAYLLQSPPVAGFSPFMTFGTGMMIFSPRSSTAIPGNPTPSSSQVLPAFLFTIGLNKPISDRLGLRLQFRALHYKTPSFNNPLLDSKTLRTTIEPTLGVFYRF